MLRLLAGHPALDFINTIDPREGAGPVEHLHAYEDLVAWAGRARVLNAATSRQATRAARSKPAAAARAFDRALALREAAYSIFRAVAARRPAPAADLHELQAAYREAMAHASLTETGRRFRWSLN